MSIALVGGREATFGSGGGEPYANALRKLGHLTLVRGPSTVADHFAADALADEAVSGDAPAVAPDYDVNRWMSAADPVDVALLDGERGPLLDIGCGPGRMIRAARDLGFTALGVDVSAAAAQVARDAGLPVLAQSVFDPMPREGGWGTLLLLDGNVGIGGDPAALLARCHELLRPEGAVIVEAHVDDFADDSFSAHVVDDRGETSAAFPWTEVGRHPLRRYAGAAGFEVSRTWEAGGRVFVRLVVAP